MKKKRKITKTDRYWYKLGFMNAEQQSRKTANLMKKVNGLLFDALQMLDKEKPIDGVKLSFVEMEKLIKMLKKGHLGFARKYKRMLDAAKATAAEDITDAIKDTINEL